MHTRRTKRGGGDWVLVSPFTQWQVLCNIQINGWLPSCLFIRILKIVTYSRLSTAWSLFGTRQISGNFVPCLKTWVPNEKTPVSGNNIVILHPFRRKKMMQQKCTSIFSIKISITNETAKLLLYLEIQGVLNSLCSVTIQPTDYTYFIPSHANHQKLIACSRITNFGPKGAMIRDLSIRWEHHVKSHKYKHAVGEKSSEFRRLLLHQPWQIYLLHASWYQLLPFLIRTGCAYHIYSLNIPKGHEFVLFLEAYPNVQKRKWNYMNSFSTSVFSSSPCIEALHYLCSSPSTLNQSLLLLVMCFHISSSAACIEHLWGHYSNWEY